MNGVLPLLKPPGMSSQEAVSRVKRIAGVARAGHAGTLDPEAAGVLPILLGRATKLSAYLTQGRKEYIAELRIGLKTDTLDSEGSIVAQSAVRFEAGDLQRILPDFAGRIEQRPPRYSAVKVDGKPLYAHARAGRSVEASPRVVQIDSIELLAGRADRFLLRIVCHQGTYIRTLLSDLAERLGTVGYTSYLLRTEAARLRIAESVLLEDLTGAGLSDLLIAPEDAVQLPRVDLPRHLFPILDSGSAIDMNRVSGVQVAPDTDYAVYCCGVFFGVGRIAEPGLVLKARIRI